MFAKRHHHLLNLSIPVSLGKIKLPLGVLSSSSATSTSCPFSQVLQSILLGPDLTIVLKYMSFILQIPVEEFTVFMISQDVVELSQNKPDSTTKQFWREHQEHIYLMYLCFSSTLVPNPDGLSPSALMHLGAEWCKGMLHQSTHHQLEILLYYYY